MLIMHSCPILCLNIIIEFEHITRSSYRCIDNIIIYEQNNLMRINIFNFVCTLRKLWKSNSNIGRYHRFQTV